MRFFPVFKGSCVIDLPSFDFLGISAETADVIETDLEDGSEWASVFAGVSGHADVVFTAIIGVSVTAESTGGNIASLGTTESASDFCKMSQPFVKGE